MRIHWFKDMCIYLLLTFEGYRKMKGQSVEQLGKTIIAHIHRTNKQEDEIICVVCKTRNKLLSPALYTHFNL